MKYRFLYLLCLIILFLSCRVSRTTKPHSKGYSPINFGLQEAKTGVERYKVLLKTHQAALAAGKDVDYTGIKSIDIEIPDNFKTIPLTNNNDFKGCIFNVKNTSKTVCLFTAKHIGKSIVVDKALIDVGDFRTIPDLKEERCLLVIEDENPWVRNRRGHDYGHQRQDILLIKNGRAKNKVVMPYNNDESSPVCIIISANNDPIIIKNLTVNRTAASTNITQVAYIYGYDDVHLSNVTVITPENELSGDDALRVYNSTNVLFTDVKIDGTYSQPRQSGYGISLRNVWNFKAVRLYGKGNCGIFANNNVNTATIEDSEINRFDIHCYGRDLTFKNVDFFDRYNQLSSVYGTVSFKNCTFTDFVPVLLGSSYNSYVGFDITMTDCVFNATPEKNCLINIGVMPTEVNARAELSKKCWPNIRISNLVVNMAEGVSEFGIFYNKPVAAGTQVDYLSEIKMDGLTVNPHPSTMVRRVYLSNNKISTSRTVACELKNVVINERSPLVKSGSAQIETILELNIPVNSGRANLIN